MKYIDNLINKFGNDKILHFLGGGFICSLITFIVILQEHDLGDLNKILSVFIGVFFVLFLSFIKEIMLDDKPDWSDVLASVLGCIPVFISVGIGVLFNVLSN